VHHGRDIVLADSAQSFSEAVSGLLRDGVRRRQYERAATELAAHYDWSVIGEQFGRTLEMLGDQASDTLERAHASVQVG